VNTCSVYIVANGKIERVTTKKIMMKKIVKEKIAAQIQNLSLIWRLIYRVCLIHITL